MTAPRTALLADCPACGGAVQDRTVQEPLQIELPPIQPTGTRFVTARGYCPACAAAVQSVHPEQISTATGAAGVVLGPRLKALAATLIRGFGHAGWRPFRLAPASGEDR